MKTYMAKKGEITPTWHLVDITDKVLGRAAVRIASILMGKHRPEYTPSVDMGDFVVVIHAENVKVTGGGKLQGRLYESYSGYPGGRKAIPLADMLRNDPVKVVTEAVRRMLPKTRLARVMLSRLKVYTGGDHPHQAQQPQALEL